MALDLDQTDIVTLLMDATEVRLRTKLIDEVSDDAKAGLVRAGKLQDDPTTKKINVLIHPGGEEYPDHINSHQSPGYGHYIESTYTIGDGGTKFYLRYIKIEFQLFYSNSPNRSDSRKKSQLVIDRAKRIMDTWDVGREVPKDDLGEHAYNVQTLSQWLFEGGGDGDFNWRGWMIVEFSTEQDLSNA